MLSQVSILSLQLLSAILEKLHGGKLPEIPFYKPEEDTPEMKYLHARREALGGYLPKRREKADEQMQVPPLDSFKAVLDPTAEGREISTTQAFVRFLASEPGQRAFAACGGPRQP